MVFWSVSDILLRGTPKVRWRLKKHPFIKENVEQTPYGWEKKTPFRRFFCLGGFFGHGA